MGAVSLRWRAVALATGHRYMYYVYVLRSLVNGRLYTGSTSDLDRRMQEHNSGQSGYTKFTKPFVLVYKEELTTLLESRRRELFLKTGKGREFLKKILGA